MASKRSIKKKTGLPYSVGFEDAQGAGTTASATRLYRPARALRCRLFHSAIRTLLLVTSAFASIPAFAVSLSLDQNFGPGEYGTFFPLATIDPGDILTGTLTVTGSQNTTASAIAQISFNGGGSTVTSAFSSIPGAETSTLTVNFESFVSALPPTLTNITSGQGFISATSTYPNGAYYPAETAAPVFGIAALPDYFTSAHVTFSGELTRAMPDAEPGAAFRAAGSSGTGGQPNQFPAFGPPTVQQFAALAQDAFETSHHETAHYTPVRTVNGDYGFSATVYQSEGGDQIVIAARGTSSADNRSAAYNTLADASFLAGTPTIPLVEEVRQLAAVVRQVANDIQPDGPLYTPIQGEGGTTGPQVSLTGYSLGGALAQIAGSGANIQAVTFLSPGAQQFDLHLELPDVNSLAALGMESPSNGIWDYRQWGDVVSLVGTQLGGTITSDNPKLLPFEKTTLGLPTLASDAFLAWGSYHSLDLLRGTLASAPTTPGSVSPQQVLGAPDALVLQLAVVGPAEAVIPFHVPDFQAKIMKYFDPQPGVKYLLQTDPDSPLIESMRLPVGGDIAGWLAMFSVGGGPMQELRSATGEFIFNLGADHIDFRPLDAAGAPTSYAEPFFFGLSVATSGPFRATLTTVGSVPEPSTFLFACFGSVGLYAFARSNRSRTAFR